MGIALAGILYAGAGGLMAAVRTPFFLVDEALIRKNGAILKDVAERAGCKILLAQKAFSMFSMYPLLREYLAGTTASGLYEARLGREEFGGETHVFAAAYRADELDEIFEICDHIIFNSFSQWERFRQKARQSGKSFGIRLNPQHSTQEHAIYDPCAPGSRMGVTLENFREELLDGIDGFHMHTLCEQGADALEETFQAAERQFGKYFKQAKWLNLGGGHHITKDGYDVERLIRLVRYIREAYDMEVYLEPGEAVALNAGWLVCSVLDIVHNGGDIAILDTSAACHMPDVLEMPYRPELVGAGQAGEKPYTYQLGGMTCLAGDMIGTYSFDAPLQVGDKLVFCDMAIYSMVKTNTFNGIGLPVIAIRRLDGTVDVIKEFGYTDFKDRLS